MKKIQDRLFFSIRLFRTCCNNSESAQHHTKSANVDSSEAEIHPNAELLPIVRPYTSATAAPKTVRFDSSKRRKTFFFIFLKYLISLC